MNETSLVHHRESNAPPGPLPLSEAEIREYLDYQASTLHARRAELMRALAANLARYPRIDDDETLGIVAENMRMAAALGRTAEDRRVAHKQPFLAGGRVVDEWFKAFAAPLQKAMSPLQSAMNDYGDRKLARERAEAEAQRLALRAEADRAALQAAQRWGEDENAVDALDAAALSAQRAEAAEARAQAKPAELTRSYGSYGAVASVREVWRYRVTDMDLVPRHYLTIDPGALQSAAKKRDRAGRPTAVIPGIEWYPETKVGVR